MLITAIPAISESFEIGGGWNYKLTSWMANNKSFVIAPNVNKKITFTSSFNSESISGFFASVQSSDLFWNFLGFGGRVGLFTNKYFFNSFANEQIPIFYQEQYINATISHRVSFDFREMTGNLYLICSPFNFFQIQFGPNFGLRRSVSTLYSQQIVAPTGLKFIGPYNSSDSSPLTNITNLRLGLNTRLSFPLKLRFIRFSPEIGGYYMFNKVEGSLSNDYQAYIGANVAINILEKNIERIILRDTVITRDTNEVMKTNIKESRVLFVERKILDTSFNTFSRTIIHERYELENPKPAAVLNGELKTTFFGSDSIESSSTELELESTIMHFLSYKKLKKTLLEKDEKRDTLNKVIIPKIRFYPNVVAEAGIKLWSIDIYYSDKKIKSFSGYGTIPQYIDWQPDNELLKQFTNGLSFQYYFNITDNENQDASAASGRISFKAKQATFRFNHEYFFVIDEKSLKDNNFCDLFFKKFKNLKLTYIDFGFDSEKVLTKLQNNFQFKIAKWIEVPKLIIENKSLITLINEQKISSYILIRSNILPEGM
ncbi:MAG: hypothetical protein NT007_03560 [Candidatus Kapabacteria bacterium]|nr:hypothetical protein [Candidatus Kapabacteria bacterium]